MNNESLMLVAVINKPNMPVCSQACAAYVHVLKPSSLLSKNVCVLSVGGGLSGRGKHSVNF